MQVRSIALVVALLTGSLLAASLLTPSTPPTADATAQKKKRRAMKPVVEGKTGQKLDQLIAGLDQDQGGFWGSALVASNGKILLCRSYGKQGKEPLATDAQWDWASVSKQFTAAAVLRLEMEKKLSLDDSIRKYYPRSPEDKQPITLRHMLNHTSGMNPRWTGQRPSIHQRDRYASQYLSQPVTSKPGVKWEYNNEAYSVLAAVVEKASKKKYEDYCIQKLFKPVKMNDTLFIGHKSLDLDRVPKDDRGRNRRWEYFDDDKPMGWNYRGMGGVVSTTIDMLRWDLALRGKKVLSKAAKKELYTVGLNNYALGWEVEKKRGNTFYTHSGRVGKHITYYLRTEKPAVVVALVYGYESPKEHPSQTAQRLYQLAAR